MNLENTPRPDRQEEIEPTNPDALVKGMTLHGQEIVNKIEGRANGVEKLIETLSEERRASLFERLISTRDKAQKTLKLAVAGATVLVAMNSPAFAEENNTENVEEDVPISLSVEIPNKSEVEDSQNRITLALYTEAAKNVYEEDLEDAKKEVIENSAKAITEKNDTSLGVVDIALGASSIMPPKWLGKSAPILTALNALNDIKDDLQNKEVSVPTILKKLGRAFLDMKTLGFGTKILDFLSKEQ